MSEMVENVAAAIYREFENRPRYAKAQMNNVLAAELARAAIEAMREPTEEMVVQAYERCHEADCARLDSNIDFAAPAWRAMIDAALGK